MKPRTRSKSRRWRSPAPRMRKASRTPSPVDAGAEDGR